MVQSAADRVLRKRAPITGLPDKLLFERNRIREVLGKQWKAAVLLSTGRLAFDYGTGCVEQALGSTGHDGVGAWSAHRRRPSARP